jgi:hypothetical protein
MVRILSHREETRVNVSSLNYQHYVSSGWGEIKFGFPQGLTLEPLLFIITIIYLTLNINSNSKLVLYDTTINYCQGTRLFVNKTSNYTNTKE